MPWSPRTVDHDQVSTFLMDCATSYPGRVEKFSPAPLLFRLWVVQGPGRRNHRARREARVSSHGAAEIPRLACPVEHLTCLPEKCTQHAMQPGERRRCSSRRAWLHPPPSGHRRLWLASLPAHGQRARGVPGCLFIACDRVSVEFLHWSPGRAAAGAAKKPGAHHFRCGTYHLGRS
jgi:hypothetical protein